MLKVQGKYLYKDDKKFFYLADTCWGAFTSITMPDWKYYLDTRKAQGFNAIQINILRQWDSSLPIDQREPFAIKENEDGSYVYDFSKINKAYFDNAANMLEEMAKRNMVPVLVLLWGNFVPDTWMSKFVSNNTIPFDQIKPYVEYAVKKFKKYNPIWFVSGDVGFTDNGKQKKDSAIKYYREVLNVAQSIDPDGIYTFHINGESTEVPEEFKKQTQMFIYQSGHGYDGQDTAYTIPEKMRKDGYQGPMMDAEICYEGLTKMKAPSPARYSAFDVRKAAWHAVLSGADAGIGYGTFGIWPWKDTARPEAKLDANFNVQLVPYDWRQCLGFRGCLDMGYLKNILEKYAPNGLTPIYTPVQDDPTIRAAENDEYLLVYLPTAGVLDFDEFNIQLKSAQVIDLQKRMPLTGKVIDNTLQMLPVVEDELVIVKK